MAAALAMSNLTSKSVVMKNLRGITLSSSCPSRINVDIRTFYIKLEPRCLCMRKKDKSRGLTPQATTTGSPMDESQDDDAAWQKFSIIEGRDTVQDFAKLQLEEIIDNIARRRNRIFLLMEEVRRLRIQQRIKSQELGVASLDEKEQSVPSAIPFLPPLEISGQTTQTLKQYYITFAALVSAIILFGGLVAPILELKLGLGGTSYADFIESVHLPMQLSQVDPIVASFSGGAVGVLSALLIVEIKNVEMQQHRQCKYCCGSGYLACARCSGRGALIQVAASTSTSSADKDGQSIGAGASAVENWVTTRCSNCGGAGKVMCPTCLCTGMALATEHDPRIDPFD